ncbi:MAG: AMIN domain-containing protein [Desulfovermiculus sp.]
MIALTPRMFPFVLLGTWLAAVGLLFAAAIHGDFELLVDAARKGEIKHELKRLATGTALRARNTVWGVIQTDVVHSNKTSSQAVLEPLAQNQSAEKNTPTPPGDLTKAGYKASEKSLRIELIFSGPAPEHTFLTLQDPARLVFDFQDVHHHKVQRRRDFSAGPVSKAIYGRHPEYLRLVLYPRESTGGENIDPDIESKGNNMQITVPGQH